MDCRVWEEPGGGVRITTFPSGLTPGQRAEACRKSLARFVHPASTFIDTDTSLLPSWPPARADRWKWRMQGGQVVVRASVPDFVEGRQALRTEIVAATTVADLKALLLKLVGGP